MARQQIHHFPTCDKHSMFWSCLLCKFFQVAVEDSICYSNSSNCHDISILQSLFGFNWGSFFLSINCLLANRNAHCSEENSKVFIHLDMAANTKLGLLNCVTCCSSWIHTGSFSGSQGIQAFQISSS